MVRDDEDDDLVEGLLRDRPDWFGPILADPDLYEIQVLYTEIDRDQADRPVFRPHRYRVDPAAYFYPASAIKLAAAALALERLHLLAVPGLDRDTCMRTEAAAPGQVAVLHDLSAPDRRPTVGHYVTKSLVVSDNDAYNRLYEFLGQQYLNEALWRRGYRDLRLTHRLSTGDSVDQGRCTNPVAFYAGDRLLYRQPLVRNPESYRAPAPILRGRETTRDFADANYASVEVLQGLLVALLFPDAVPATQRFGLRPDDYALLRRALSMLPGECRRPRYDRAHYYDSYVKFFLFGDSREPMPQRIRLYNKVGIAWGYMVDNAYVVDLEHGVEFLLTAVISANPERTFGGGYAYDAIGFPFLSRLGKAVYDHERRRPRPRSPNLRRLGREWDVRPGENLSAGTTTDS